MRIVRRHASLTSATHDRQTQAEAQAAAARAAARAVELANRAARAALDAQRAAAPRAPRRGRKRRRLDAVDLTGGSPGRRGSPGRGSPNRAGPSWAAGLDYVDLTGDSPPRRQRSRSRSPQRQQQQQQQLQRLQRQIQQRRHRALVAKAVTKFKKALYDTNHVTLNNVRKFAPGTIKLDGKHYAKQGLRSVLAHAAAAGRAPQIPHSMREMTPAEMQAVWAP